MLQLPIPAQAHSYAPYKWRPHGSSASWRLASPGCSKGLCRSVADAIGIDRIACRATSIWLCLVCRHVRLPSLGRLRGGYLCAAIGTPRPAIARCVRSAPERCLRRAAATGMEASSDRYTIGDMMTRAVADISLVQRLIAMGTILLVILVYATLVGFGFMLYLSPTLTLLLLPPLPFVFYYAQLVRTADGHRLEGCAGPHVGPGRATYRRTCPASAPFRPWCRKKTRSTVSSTPTRPTPTPSTSAGPNQLVDGGLDADTRGRLLDHHHRLRRLPGAGRRDERRSASSPS